RSRSRATAVRRSSTERPDAAMRSATRSALCRRSVASVERPAAVSATRWARESSGCGDRSAQPRSTMPLTRPLIVGWLQRSCSASRPTVLGPSSSSRLISRVLAAGRSTLRRRTSRTRRASSTTSSLLSRCVSSMPPDYIGSLCKTPSGGAPVVGCGLALPHLAGGRLDPAGDLAERDPAAEDARGGRAQYDLVAVLEEGPLAATGGERLGAAP